MAAAYSALILAMATFFLAVRSLSALEVALPAASFAVRISALIGTLFSPIASSASLGYSIGWRATASERAIRETAAKKRDVLNILS